MAQLLATYSLNGERHRIELVGLRDGALLLDRRADGAPRVVAELSRDEGEDQALAVLHAGGYLERAGAGEAGLCRALAGDEGLGRAAGARAA
jgi:hypothetical protein